jgi:anti-sigma B factor antagonist
MPDPSLPTALVRGVPVVSTPTKIDHENAHMVQAALERWVLRGYATLVADLRRTRVCDAAGLSALLSVHRRAAAEGGELRVVAVGTAAPAVVSMTRRSGLMRHFGSLGAAVAESPAAAIAPIG